MIDRLIKNGSEMKLPDCDNCRSAISVVTALAECFHGIRSITESESEESVTHTKQSSLAEMNIATIIFLCSSVDLFL